MHLAVLIAPSGYTPSAWRVGMRLPYQTNTCMTTGRCNADKLQLLKYRLWLQLLLLDMGPQTVDDVQHTVMAST